MRSKLDNAGIYWLLWFSLQTVTIWLKGLCLKNRTAYPADKKKKKIKMH